MESQRDKTAALLKRKIERRPDKQVLINRRILRDSIVSASPFIQEKCIALRKNQLRETLNNKLDQRPGSLELVEKGVLKVHPVLATLIKRGSIPYPRVGSSELSTLQEVPEDSNSIDSIAEKSANPLLSRCTIDISRDRRPPVSKPAISRSTKAPSRSLKDETITRRYGSLVFHDYRPNLSSSSQIVPNSCSLSAELLKQRAREAQQAELLHLQKTDHVRQQLGMEICRLNGNRLASLRHSELACPSSSGSISYWKEIPPNNSSNSGQQNFNKVFFSTESPVYSIPISTPLPSISISHNSNSHVTVSSKPSSFSIIPTTFSSFQISNCNIVASLPGSLILNQSNSFENNLTPAVGILDTNYLQSVNITSANLITLQKMNYLSNACVNSDPTRTISLNEVEFHPSSSQFPVTSGSPPLLTTSKSGPVSVSLPPSDLSYRMTKNQYATSATDVFDSECYFLTMPPPPPPLPPMRHANSMSYVLSCENYTPVVSAVSSFHSLTLPHGMSLVNLHTQDETFSSPMKNGKSSSYSATGRCSPNYHCYSQVPSTFASIQNPIDGCTFHLPNINTLNASDNFPIRSSNHGLIAEVQRENSQCEMNTIPSLSQIEQVWIRIRQLKQAISEELSILSVNSSAVDGTLCTFNKHMSVENPDVRLSKNHLKKLQDELASLSSLARMLISDRLDALDERGVDVTVATSLQQTNVTPQNNYEDASSHIDNMKLNGSQLERDLLQSYLQRLGGTFQARRHHRIHSLDAIQCFRAEDASVDFSSQIPGHPSFSSPPASGPVRRESLTRACFAGSSLANNIFDLTNTNTPLSPLETTCLNNRYSTILPAADNFIHGRPVEDVVQNTLSRESSGFTISPSRDTEARKIHDPSKDLELQNEIQSNKWDLTRHHNGSLPANLNLEGDPEFLEFLLQSNLIGGSAFSDHNRHLLTPESPDFPSKRQVIDFSSESYVSAQMSNADTPSISWFTPLSNVSHESPSRISCIERSSATNSPLHFSSLSIEEQAEICAELLASYDASSSTGHDTIILDSQGRSKSPCFSSSSSPYSLQTFENVEIPTERFSDTGKQTDIQKLVYNCFSPPVNISLLDSAMDIS